MKKTEELNIYIYVLKTWTTILFTIFEAYTTALHGDFEV